MADQTLLNYVEQVYNLESERHTLMQIIDRLNQECSQKRNQIQAENVNYNYSHDIKETESGTGAKVKIGIGIFVAMGGLATASGIMIAYFIVAFFLIAYGIADLKSIHDIEVENARKRQEAINNADRHFY